MSIFAFIPLQQRGALRALALAFGLLILGAYVLEYGFNAKPCAFCWYQRYVHWALFGVALVALIQPKISTRRALHFLAGLLVLGIGIGVYHSLIEAHVVLAGCAQPLSQLTADPAVLLAQLSQAPVPSCDRPFKLLGFSLPQWNIAAQGILLLYVVYVLRLGAGQVLARAIKTKTPQAIVKKAGQAQRRSKKTKKR